MSVRSSGRPGTRRLSVVRRLGDGSRTDAGTLARDARANWFEYAAGYLASGASLSPFELAFEPGPREAKGELPSRTDPLHGVFVDALPDGWGLALMDRAFRRRGIEPGDVTGLDRLAFLGERGGGALAFAPPTHDPPGGDDPDVDLGELGRDAARAFEGDAAAVRDALVRSGGSGGARPKAYLWRDAADRYSTVPIPGASARLVKFTSADLPLGHDEGRCELAWLRMAARAGLDAQRGELVEPGGADARLAWLSLERFDCTAADGRLHLHSASGLLGADHRLPSLDAADLVRASELLCRSPATARETFRRAMFNLLSANQDDHAKNWAWLMDDGGTWRPSPAFDVTFSPSPSGEHATSFGGHGRAPPPKAVLELGRLASLDVAGVRGIVGAVDEALSGWSRTAGELGVARGTTREIGRRLARVRRDNAALLAL